MKKGWRLSDRAPYCSTMTYPARVVEVMIASPGDVAAERQIFREVLHEWNTIHAREHQLVVMPVGWETHSSPRLGERPQEVINEQILQGCDLLVGIFWTRLGTPTGEAASGTVEEIEKHVAAGRPAMLYFSQAPVHIDSVDQTQYAALRAFRDEYMKRGLVEFYASPEEFRDKFARQFAQTLNRDFLDGAAAAAFAAPAQPAELSADALHTLREAAKDAGVVTAEYFGAGTLFRANDTVLFEGADAREEARWEAVLAELVERGYLLNRGGSGEVFTVTDAGYKYVEGH
jgi:hypothetical protein